MLTVENFLEWERLSRDTIDFKRCYVDLAGDLVSGLLLSQIIYWFLPSKEGSKLRVEREGSLWLAKSRADWWEECRISPKQFDRAITVLRDKGLVMVRRFKFRGSPTIHVQLDLSVVVEGVNSILTKGEEPILPKVNLQVDERVKTLTETTTETTSKTTIYTKKKYGIFDNVLLTEEEYYKLIERFGAEAAQDRIADLSHGIASKGYKYKSHYATILNWSRREEIKKSDKKNDPDKYIKGKYAHVVRR